MPGYIRSCLLSRLVSGVLDNALVGLMGDNEPTRWFVIHREEQKGHTVGS